MSRPENMTPDEAEIWQRMELHGEELVRDMGAALMQADKLPEWMQEAAVNMLCDSDLARHAPAPVPTFVAVGEHDVVTPPAACERWASVYQAPFALLPGAGHASPTEQPGAVVSWIVHHTSNLP